MEHRFLDLEHYPRRAQFDYFRHMAYPYAGITVNMDLTALLSCVRERGLPFYLTLLYAASRAANAVPEFRRRIQGEGVIEFAHCMASYTLALDNGSYCYCLADDRPPFPAYLTDATRRQEAARSAAALQDGDSAENLFFFSSLPWVSYTAIVQPVPTPADSNPRITWGKYVESGGRWTLPVSVLVHHALMDGLHISNFFQELQQRLDTPDWLYGSSHSPLDPSGENHLNI